MKKTMRRAQDFLAVVAVSGVLLYFGADGWAQDSRCEFVARYTSFETADGIINCSGFGEFAITQRGYVYVPVAANHCILKFYSDGSELLYIGWYGRGSETTGWHEAGSGESWGLRGSGQGQFEKPRSVAVDASNIIYYVADLENGRIQKLTNAGDFQTQWEMDKPLSVTVGSGSVFTTTPRHTWKFTSDGVYITKWPEIPTQRDGGFEYACGVTVGASGDVYVVDGMMSRVQKFGSDGSFRTKWGQGGDRDGEFNHPQGIAMDKHGNVFVADRDNNRVQQFSSDGTFLGWLGRGTSTTGWHGPNSPDYPLLGKGEGEFTHPIAVAVGPNRNLYVVDVVSIQIFRLPDGAPDEQEAETEAPAVPTGIVEGNYIVNGNFGNGLQGWRVHKNKSPGEFSATIIDDAEKGSCVELKRTGSHSSGRTVLVDQPLSIDLSQWEELHLEADVKVIHGSLYAGGGAGVEYPAAVLLIFMDSNDDRRVWLHGFHYAREWYYDWDNWTRTEQAQWYHWRSDNLAARNPDGSTNYLFTRSGHDRFAPARITKIDVRAQGWDMESRVTNLRFVGKRK